jgi:DNA polymerase I-like protein with 3'-5' exonuclease and polymerase domains
MASLIWIVKDLGISFKDAKKYIERYFEQYKQVSEWMLSVVEYAKTWAR